MMSIADVLLSTFIDWTINKNYPDEAEYNDLVTQYASLLKIESFEKQTRLLIQIAQNKTRFMIAEKCIQVLEVGYIKEAVAELRELGIMGEYNPNVPSKYEMELKRAYSRAKSFLQMAKQKEAELLMLQKDNQGEDNFDPRVTREAFDNNIISLNKFYGYNIRENEISLQKYCLMIKRMDEYGKTYTRTGGSSSVRPARKTSERP